MELEFSGWLYNEGFHLDMSEIPHQEIMDALGNLKAKNAVRDIAMQRGKFGYERKDHLEDLIHLEPIIKSKILPYVIPSHPLQSFEEKHAKIYYAFAFSPIEEFGDSQVVEPVLKRVGRGYNWEANKDERIERINEILAEIEKQLEFINSKPALFAKRITVQEMVKTGILKAVNYGNPPDSYFCDPVTKKPYNLDPNQTVLQKQLSKLEVKLLHYHETYRKQLSQIQSQIGGPENKISDKNLGNQYYNALKLAFTKILKHPQSPGSKKLQIKFMDEAIAYFLRANGNKRYNIVLYPESSSEFNKLFAAKLAKKFGTKAFQAFNKPSVGTAPTLDEKGLRYEFARRAKEKHAAGEKYPVKIGKGGSGGVSAEDDSDGTLHFQQKLPYLQDLLTKRLNNKKATSRISNFTDKDFRKYVNMFDTIKGNYKGQDVLLIDDNVDGGGTFERLFDLLIKQNPRSIDIFAPLNMGGTH